MRRLLFVVVAALAAGVLAYLFTRARTGVAQPAAPGSVAAPAPTARTMPAHEPAASARDPGPAGRLRLEGLVVDHRAQPVAAAEVVVSTEPPTTVTTDSDGSFALDGLSAGTYTASAWKDDRYAAAVAFPLRATTEPLILHLRLGSTLAVRVLDDATGRPIEGAEVARRGRVARTGPDGVAELRGLGPWFHGLSIRADGYAPADADVSLGEDPGGRSEREVRLHRGAAAPPAAASLDRGARLAGIVVDAAGAPVAAAAVIVDARSGEHRATTGPDGRFALAGLPRAELAAYARHGRDASVVVAVDARAGDRDELRLALAPAMITGVVTDADGAPVAEARVSATPRARGVLGDHRADVADAAGRFELGPLPSGAYRLVAARPDAPAANRYLTPAAATADAGARDVRLVLAATGAIGGVVTLDGTPVPRFAIAIAERAPSLAFAQPELIRAPDGRFTRAAVPAGTYVLRLVGEGFAPQSFRGVVVTAGATTDLGTITVERGLEVRGRIVDAAGAPVAGAKVVVGRFPATDDRLDDAPLRGLLMDQHQTTSARDGRFVIRGVAPANGRPMHASAHLGARGRSRDVEVVPPATDVDLVIEAAP